MLFPFQITFIESSLLVTSQLKWQEIGHRLYLTRTVLFFVILCKVLTLDCKVTRIFQPLA